MLDDIEIGKIIRRSLKDQNGRLVNKIFRVIEVIAESQDWKVANVIDQDTMQKVTLKVLSKTDRMCKTQIVSEIKNQKKMSGKHNFVSLRQVYEDNLSIYLLMDLWGVSLEKILMRRHTLMERQVQLIFCQLVDVLQNLRSANISHGNITLSCVLLAPGKVNALQLTQFSQSQDISLLEPSMQKTAFRIVNPVVRSKARWDVQKSMQNIAEGQAQGGRMIRLGQRDINEYTSPQQYRQEKDMYNRDIWSSGVLLYKLLTGIFPFSQQEGKIILNKIKYATFSFPTLQQTKPMEGLSQSDLKNMSNLQFLSSEWKQLLKKMIAERSQRISLKQLINHPLKQAYFNLKDVPDLKSSQPSLVNLFSVKKNQNQTFKKIWKINFQDQNQNQNELDLKINYEELIYKATEDYKQTQIEDKTLYRDNLRGSTIAEPKQDNRSKDFRVHKTQFGISISDSIKNVDQNQRYQTLNPFRQRSKKDKQESIITPISQTTQSPPMPLVVKEPPFILKFHYFKKSKWLGYILNNAIGVVFADGEHVIGHSKQQFRYIQDETAINSQLMINQADAISMVSRTIKQSIYKNQPRLAAYHKTLQVDYFLKQSKLNNCKSQQASNKQFNDIYASNFQLNKVINSTINSEKGLLNMGKQKRTIYLKAIDYFGLRVVKDTLDVWVDQFWKDGNIYVFLLNTGCWQVAFCYQKAFRIYAIDQYDLIWSKDISSSDLTHHIRQIVKKYAPLAKNKKNVVIKA